MEDVHEPDDQSCPSKVSQTLVLVDRLYELADDAVGTCNQDVCLVFFGVVRDCAYAIRRAAQTPAVQQLTVEGAAEPGSGGS